MTRIAAATHFADFEQARAIFREYADSLPAGHVCLSAFKRELAELESWYSLILLAFDGDSLAGAVAMRRLDDAACEMKRLYVRAQWRGTGLGRQLVERIIVAARDQGYRFVRLDTMREMADAIRLYRRFGFREIAPYSKNPVGAICLELEL